jgi:hypothetical protein
MAPRGNIDAPVVEIECQLDVGMHQHGQVLPILRQPRTVWT